MKRLILCNIFAISAMFGISAMQEGASGPGIQTGSPLRRMNSQMLLHVVDDFKEPSLIESINQERYAERVNSLLSRCKEHLGRKSVVEDKHGRRQEIDTIDISCESIMAYAERVTDSVAVNSSESELADFLHFVRNIIDDTRASDNWAQTAFADDELDDFHHKFCSASFWMGGHLCSAVAAEFKNMYHNFTIFQSCVSLLLVHQLNQIGGDVGVAKSYKIDMQFPHNLDLVKFSQPTNSYVYARVGMPLMEPYTVVKFSHRALKNRPSFLLEANEILTILLLDNLLGDVKNYRDLVSYGANYACLSSRYIDFAELFHPFLKCDALINKTVERLLKCPNAKKMKTIKSCEQLLVERAKGCIPLKYHLKLVDALRDISDICTSVDLCVSADGVVNKYNKLVEIFRGLLLEMLNFFTRKEGGAKIVYSSDYASRGGLSLEENNFLEIMSLEASCLKCLEFREDANMILSEDDSIFTCYIAKLLQMFSTWQQEANRLPDECINDLVASIYKALQEQFSAEVDLEMILRSDKLPFNAYRGIIALLLQYPNDCKKVKDYCLKACGFSQEIADEVQRLGQLFHEKRKYVLADAVSSWRGRWKVYNEKPRHQDFGRDSFDVFSFNLCEGASNEGTHNRGISKRLYSGHIDGLQKESIGLSKRMYSTGAPSGSRGMSTVVGEFCVSRASREVTEAYVLADSDITQLYRILYSFERASNGFYFDLLRRYEAYSMVHVRNEVDAVAGKLLREKYIPEDEIAPQSIMHLTVLASLLTHSSDIFYHLLSRNGIIPVSDTCIIRNDQHLLIADKRRMMLEGCYGEEALDNDGWGNGWILSVATPLENVLAIDIEHIDGVIRSKKCAKKLLANEVRWVKRSMGDRSIWVKACRPIPRPMVGQARNWELVAVAKDELAGEGKCAVESFELPA